MKKLSHIDEAGKAKMVDVATKPETLRVAIASGAVLLAEETIQLIQRDGLPKGDVLTVAKLAGIMGAKRTADLIPLCHPLALTGIDVTLEVCRRGVEISARVSTTGKTGVEMEALTAVAVAGLTIYDMVKAVDRSAVITEIRLDHKSGGASGEFHRERAEE